MVRENKDWFNISGKLMTFMVFKGNDHVFMGLVCISFLIKEPKSFATLCTASLWILPPSHLCISSLNVGQIMQVIDLWAIFFFYLFTSGVIIAKSGEHFAYNPLYCSAAFYKETISFLEHSHSLASLSLLGSCFCPPQTCLFWSAFCLLLPFPVSWPLVFHLYALLDNLIQLPPEFCVLLSLYLAVWCVFQISHVSISTRQDSPVPHAWVKLVSYGVSDLSGWYNQCLGQGLFPLLSMFSQSPRPDGGTSQIYLFSLSTLLLPYLMPLSPTQTIKMTY